MKKKALIVNPNQVKLDLEIIPKTKTVKGLNKILQAPVTKGWNKTK